MAPEHSPFSASDQPPPAGPARLARAEAVAMTLMGVDWGRRRIGLAVKPAGQDWALPQATLAINNEKQALEFLRQAIDRAQAQGVVVGLPIHPDPSQAQEIKRFCRKARRETSGIRWFFVDESLTTQAAETISQWQTGNRPADDLAAALILETFLQSCP